MSRTIQIAPVRKTIVVEATPERAFTVFTAGIDRWWRAPWKGGAFPVGESPTRRQLQPEATGATVEVTKRLKPSVKRATKYGGSASVQAVTQVNAG